MQNVNKWIAISLLAVGGGSLAACNEESSYKKIIPAKMEQIEGSKVKRITLTPEAIKRLDLKTVVVRETQVADDGSNTTNRKVVPYGSLIYDEFGKTWVYAQPQEGSFVRTPVEVDYIDGDDAFLLDGPPKETPVATSGAAELYGVEGGMGGKK